MNNTSIAPRVTRSFLAIFLTLLGPTLLAAWNLRAVSMANDELVHSRLAKQQLVAEWLGNARLDIALTFALAKSDSVEASDFFQAQLKDGDAQTARLRAKLAPLPLDADEERQRSEVLRAEDAFRRVRQQLIQLKDSGRTQDVEQVCSSALPGALKAYVASLTAMLTHQADTAGRLADAVTLQYRRGEALLAMCGIAALAIGVWLALRLARSIIGPLRAALALAHRVAQGKLHVDAEQVGSDEIGSLVKALNDMTARLAHVVTDVRDGAHRIDDAARELAGGNADLARRTAQQASSVEQAVSSLSELAIGARANSQSARLANELASSSANVALRGGAVVDQVVATMDAIHNSAQRIVDIIGVIDSIAFQTNILALNAAVEAARAGEQGRGFAVVASEVRQLAQRAATAAGEIKGLITDSSTRIEHGNGLAQAAGSTMQEIVASVQRVTEVLHDIAAASAEQEAGIHDLERAVSAIDDVTQQNSALVEEASAAAEAMRCEAIELSTAMNFFALTRTQAEEATHVPSPALRLAA